MAKKPEKPRVTIQRAEDRVYIGINMETGFIVESISHEAGSNLLVLTMARRVKKRWQKDIAAAAKKRFKK